MSFDLSGIQPGGPTGGGGGGVSDHGALTGLADDDHAQYVKDAGDDLTGALVFPIAGTDRMEVTPAIDEWTTGILMRGVGGTPETIQIAGYSDGDWDDAWIIMRNTDGQRVDVGPGYVLGKQPDGFNYTQLRHSSSGSLLRLTRPDSGAYPMIEMMCDDDDGVYINLPAGGEYRVGGVPLDTGGGGPTEETRSDFVAPYIYYGRAPSGTADSATGWHIDRIEVEDDGTVTVTTAQGSFIEWTQRTFEVYA